MVIVLALSAAVLTSWLPICTKVVVQDARPALVAWAINAASLPLLAVGTLILTGGMLPRVDGVFAVVLLFAAALNWLATLLSTRALAEAEAGLVTPLLTFNPAFTLLAAWVVLGERPSVREVVGVVVILVGAYLLEDMRADGLAPLRALLQRSGARLALIASACWGVTTVLEKIAIRHASPPSGPLIALASTALTVVLLTPGAFASPKAGHVPGTRGASSGSRGLWRHLRVLTSAILIAGIAPLFGFTAIAQGDVGVVTALFKLSAVLTIVWARLFLGEGHLRERLVGAGVMLMGGALIAA